jgi:hypothetical protein
MYGFRPVRHGPGVATMTAWAQFPTGSLPAVGGPVEHQLIPLTQQDLQALLAQRGPDPIALHQAEGRGT